MQKIPFGATGLHVSPLGFGSAPLGFQGIRPEQAATILNTLLDHGVNLIDTAAKYDFAEQLIGQALGQRRGECVIVSKCGYEVEGPDGVSGQEWSEPLITASIERSLRKLRTDYLDVMLLHSCERSVLEQGKAVEALAKARDAGKIRFVGYSGDNEAAAYAARLPDVSVIETSINLCDESNIEKVLPIARARELGVLAKRPLANGAWKAAEAQPEEFRDYAAEYRFRFEKMGLDREALGLPATTRWDEIALRFTLSQPGVHSAIVGTTRPEHILSNIAAAEAGPLPPEVIEKIRQAFAAAEAKYGEPWLGLT